MLVTLTLTITNSPRAVNNSFSFPTSVLPGRSTPVTTNSNVPSRTFMPTPATATATGASTWGALSTLDCESPVAGLALPLSPVALTATTTTRNNTRLSSRMMPGFLNQGRVALRWAFSFIATPSLSHCPADASASPTTYLRLCTAERTFPSCEVHHTTNGRSEDRSARPSNGDKLTQTAAKRRSGAQTCQGRNPQGAGACQSYGVADSGRPGGTVTVV